MTTLAAAIDRSREDYINGDDSEGSYPVIQAGIPVQFNISAECNLLVPDSLVMKICACGLKSAIYCIAWTFFLLQQGKTCNSQSNSMGGLHVIFKLTYCY